MRTTGLRVQPLILGLLLSLPGGAGAFTVADTNGDGTGEELRWDTTDPVPFRFHFRGSDDLGVFTLPELTRRSFQTWADVGIARFSFEEGRIYTGPPEHHTGPSEVDGQSVLFFTEAAWPHGSEVIALTSVSFAADGEILDADIAFNGADHTFTTADNGGVKDYMSIATHEIGHFIGLNHSLDGEATMFAEYEDGQTFLRDLNPDDEAGAEHLDPGNAAPCRGIVVWRDQGNGCDSAGGTATVLALLLVGGVLGLRRRQRLAPVAVGAIAGALMLVPGPATSTLVEELPITALSDGADRVVRGTVVERETFFDGIVRTRVTLVVSEDWVGEGGETVELVLPGGILEEPVEVIGADGKPLKKPVAGTLVFGAPRAALGDDVVVFVDRGAEVNTVRGLSQGLFRVDPDGGIGRDVSGLAFARTLGSAPLPTVAPTTLEGLRAAVMR